VSYNHKNFYGFNASVVKICNTMSSLDRFESKTIFFHFKERSIITTTLAL
jgi:hypothetical protein